MAAVDTVFYIQQDTTVEIDLPKLRKTVDKARNAYAKALVLKNPNQDRLRGEWEKLEQLLCECETGIDLERSP